MTSQISSNSSYTLNVAAHDSVLGEIVAITSVTIITGESYSDWLEIFFPPAEQLNPLVIGADRDPD